MMSELRQQQIDRYVLRKMSLEERKAFEQEMAHDEHLAYEVNLVSDIKKSLTALEEKKHMMKMWDEQLKQKADKSVKMASAWAKWKIPSLVALAACVVLCFLPLMHWNDETGHGDLLTEPSASALSPVEGNGESGVRGTLSTDEVASLIELKQYDKALSTIKEMQRRLTVDPNLPVEEKEYISQIQKDELYVLTWYKIVSLFKLGREEEALQSLQTFVGQEGMYQTDAKKLFDKLKK